MKKLQKYSILFVIVYCNAMYGMLINKKFVDNLKTAREHHFYGLVTATMPQMSKGALGNFRLDKKYGVTDYLAQYIAFDKKISLQDAVCEGFDTIAQAYKQFLNHNSSAAIQAALNNNVIDTDYAVQALYFTHKVATQLRDYIEDKKYFTHRYVDDPEQYIWVDIHASNPNRRQLDKDIKNEQKAVIDLVDFLQQRPVNKNYKTKSSEGIFKKKQSSDERIIFHSQLKQLKDKVEPAAIAQTWDGLLGNFALLKEQNCKARCTIQDYLCKYIANNLQISEDAVATEATFLDIKKAFESFVNHNHPDAILRDFKNELITKQHAKDALAFTFWVVNAFEKYLEDFKDDAYEMELFELFWQMNRMKDKAADMRFVAKGEWNSTIRE